MTANPLRRLNYHHLLYFRTVVAEGGVQPAARALGLTHPTVSGQIRQLEEQLGRPLFDRGSRRLALTEAGAVVYRYAEELFGLGDEMLRTLDGQPADRPPPLLVGVEDGMPKTLARNLLAPTLELPVRLVCQQDRHDRLLSDLSVHRLDVVLADSPLPPGFGVNAFSHLLGETGVAFVAAPAQARALRSDFPQSLHGAPFLAPAEGTTLRRAATRFFREQEIEPRLVGEFSDSAMMKAFGSAGYGAFCVPTAMLEDVRGIYGVEPVGEAAGVRWRFYAISPERRVTNPAVAAICVRGAVLLA